MTDDPRCKEPLPSGGICGGVDAHVPECPRNELRDEFDRQDGGLMPDKPKQDWPQEPWSEPEVDSCARCRKEGTSEWDVQEISAGYHAQFAAKGTAYRIVACVNALAGVPDPAAWVAAVERVEDALRGLMASNTAETYEDAFDEATEALAALDRAAGGEGGG